MANTDITDLESLKRYAAEKNLTLRVDQGTYEPRVLAPYHWKWADVEPAVIGSSKYVRLATDFEDRGGAVRRLTGIANPRNSKGARVPLTLFVQCVLPGEQALSHRHSAGATRFVIRGSSNAYTLVDGEPFPLEDGDFITTPHLNFHGHANESDDYVLWLDGLDGSYAGYGARFGEEWPEAHEVVDHNRVGESAKALGGHLRRATYPGIIHPAGPQVRHIGAEHPPGFRYSWTDTLATFTALRQNEDEPDPFDCYTLTYRHPITGGPTFPTTANEITLLTPGFKGRDHRHNSTVIYYAFGGSGTLVAEGERFEWSKGDFIELPPWTTHRHENPSNEDGFLYGFTDWPAQKALGQFYFEEFA
jgi:gentisate 1,2-dioxygenase